MYSVPKLLRDIQPGTKIQLEDGRLATVVVPGPSTNRTVQSFVASDTITLDKMDRSQERSVIVDGAILSVDQDTTVYVNA